jgi:hypothetical protein
MRSRALTLLGCPAASARVKENCHSLVQVHTLSGVGTSAMGNEC